MTRGHECSHPLSTLTGSSLWQGTMNEAINCLLWQVVPCDKGQLIKPLSTLTVRSSWQETMNRATNCLLWQVVPCGKCPSAHERSHQLSTLTGSSLLQGAMNEATSCLSNKEKRKNFTLTGRSLWKGTMNEATSCLLWQVDPCDKGPWMKPQLSTLTGRSYDKGPWMKR